MRGSDRSLRSHKRDIDDLALSNIMPGGTINRSTPSTPKLGHSTGYGGGGGRRDVDDMMINTFLNGQSLQLQGRVHAVVRDPFLSKNIRFDLWWWWQF